jgi:hypothetical protein
LKGSIIENEVAGGVMRQEMPVGSGAKKEQQEQQEQLKLQPSEPCRSVQGQCETGSLGEAISSRDVPV